MKLINYIVNLALKLSNIASNGLSALSNISLLLKKDRINSWKQKSYKCGFIGHNIKYKYEELVVYNNINFMDNILWKIN